MFIEFRRGVRGCFFFFSGAIPMVEISPHHTRFLPSSAVPKSLKRLKQKSEALISTNKVHWISRIAIPKLVNFNFRPQKRTSDALTVGASAGRRASALCCPRQDLGRRIWGSVLDDDSDENGSVMYLNIFVTICNNNNDNENNSDMFFEKEQ